MSGTPKFKCFRGKEYVAAVKYAEDAAVLLSSDVIDRISYDRAVDVWVSSDSTEIAANSYDDAAEIMHRRLRIHNIKQAKSIGYSVERIQHELHHSPAEIAEALGETQ